MIGHDLYVACIRGPANACVCRHYVGPQTLLRTFCRAQQASWVPKKERRRGSHVRAGKSRPVCITPRVQGLLTGIRAVLGFHATGSACENIHKDQARRQTFPQSDEQATMTQCQSDQTDAAVGPEHQESREVGLMTAYVRGFTHPHIALLART